MEQIDRAAVNVIKTEAVAALRDVAERFGLEFQYKGGSFGAGVFNMRVQFAAAAQKAKEDAVDAQLLGLPEDAIGRTVTLRGTVFRVVGVNLRRPKFPIEAERVPDGKRFKLTADSVKAQLVQ